MPRTRVDLRLSGVTLASLLADMAASRGDLVSLNLLHDAQHLTERQQEGFFVGEASVSSVRTLQDDPSAADTSETLIGSLSASRSQLR